MHQTLRELHGLLARLGARERRLLAGRAVLQALSVALVCLVVAAALLSTGATRALVVGLVGGLGGLLTWVAFGWPLLRRWRPAGDPRRQARLLEQHETALRSRLITAIELGASAAPTGSSPLLARAAERAAKLAAAVPAARVHPARPVRLAGASSGLAMVLALVAGLWLPVGPLDAVAALWSGSTAAARLDEAELPPADDRALVGDIVLRYVYPDYTGLGPVEIPNSDGTIHAPPGTVVTISARTAEPFEAAAIQVGEAPPEDVTLRGGRDLSATLTVEAEGVWRFLLFRGPEAHFSADYRIVLEADAPPVVTLQGPGELEVAADTTIALGWQASDDYGLERVVVEVEHLGETREYALRDPLETPLSLVGELGRTPRELGLRPGDEATLRFAAWDNDHLAGSKRGVSTAVKLTVLGPRGEGRRMARYYESLLDALLPVLADFLEEPSPPATDPAAVWAWSGAARPRFDPVREIVESQWRDEVPSGLDGTVINRVLETAARLFRFTATAFDPDGGVRPSARDLETLAQLHGEEIVALEQAIFVLDMVLRQVSLTEVAMQARDVAVEAQEITELLEADASSAALLSRLDQLERMLSRLASAAAKLSEGQLREFTNARTEEALDLIEAARKAIAEGRLDDAKAMLEQLSSMLSQLSEGLDEQLASSQEQSDELGERLDQLKKDLSALEQDQRDLARELAAAREQEGGKVGEVVDAWERLDPLVLRASRLACGAASLPGDGLGWRSSAVRKLADNCSLSEDLQSAVRARDAVGSLTRLSEADLKLRLATNDVANEQRRVRPETDPVPSGVRLAAEALDEQGSVYDEIREILENLAQQNVSMSPELQRAAQQLAQKQQQLGQRQERLSQEVQTVEQAMPTGDGSAGRSMGEAGDAMGRAKEALESGDAMAGQGHQQHAADQIAATKRTLERQQAEAQQMQQAMNEMSGGQQGKGQEKGQSADNRNGEDAAGRSNIEIPAPESFRTPEAYREALLEGMEADVPDEYRALKQRYYEELVRQ